MNNVYVIPIPVTPGIDTVTTVAAPTWTALPSHKAKVVRFYNSTTGGTLSVRYGTGVALTLSPGQNHKFRVLHNSNELQVQDSGGAVAHPFYYENW